MAFSGFPEGKVRLVPIPGPFFQELLPQIDHLGELKTTLFAFWHLDRVEVPFRYLRVEDFLADPHFVRAIASNPKHAAARLDEALRRAVARGTLLEATVDVESRSEKLYFLNSPRGRAAISAIQRGEWRYSGDTHHPLEIRVDLPNIYRLYEENIGLLTPMIAEELKEAESAYPAEWIEDAVRIAVENNARNWRYVSAILNRWKEKGRHERKNRRDTEKDRRRYADWEDVPD
jgi:DnaD/phage-associated family protein